MRKLIIYFWIILLGFLIIPISTNAQTTGPITHEIVIKNFAFSPNELQIAIGDIVVFIWESGAAGHNVEQVSNANDLSYNSGGFKSGEPQSGPAEWALPSSYTQENATLFYICGPHVLSHNMRGKIIVGAGSDGVEETGGNLGMILAIFLGMGVVTFGSIFILQKRKKTV